MYERQVASPIRIDIKRKGVTTATALNWRRRRNKSNHKSFAGPNDMILQQVFNRTSQVTTGVRNSKSSQALGGAPGDPWDHGYMSSFAIVHSIVRKNAVLARQIVQHARIC